MPELAARRRARKILRAAEIMMVIAFAMASVATWQAVRVTDAQRSACKRGDAIRAVLRLSLETQVLAIMPASRLAQDPELRAQLRVLLPKLSDALASDDLNPKC